jgi:hypothetical protein
LIRCQGSPSTRTNEIQVPLGCITSRFGNDIEDIEGSKLEEASDSMDISDDDESDFDLITSTMLEGISTDRSQNSSFDGIILTASKTGSSALAFNMKFRCQRPLTYRRGSVQREKV